MSRFLRGHALSVAMLGAFHASPESKPVTAPHAQTSA